jgi:hypothetical protein
MLLHHLWVFKACPELNFIIYLCCNMWSLLLVTSETHCCSKYLFSFLFSLYYFSAFWYVKLESFHPSRARISLDWGITFKIHGRVNVFFSKSPDRLTAIRCTTQIVFLGGKRPNLKLNSQLYLQTALKMWGVVTIATILLLVTMLN